MIGLFKRKKQENTQPEIPIFNLKTRIDPNNSYREWVYNTGCDGSGDMIEVPNQNFLGEFHVDSARRLIPGLVEGLKTHYFDITMPALWTTWPRLNQDEKILGHYYSLEFKERKVCFRGRGPLITKIYNREPILEE